MGKAFEISWTKDLRKQASQAMKQAAVRGVSDAAEALLQDANKTAPHADGTMRGSGTATVDADRVAAAVAYDTPYTVRQHEDTRLRHPDPNNPKSDPRGRPKWLELTLKENSTRYRDRIARSIRSTAGK